MTTIERHFVEVDGRCVHYRRAGAGPAVVMLHGSPNSSLSLTPLMERFAADFTAIALDTPGNGESAPLPQSEPDTGDYAEALARTLDALGIGRAAFYGFHTGAGTAAELAVRYPGRVSGLLLDGCAAWSEEEKRGMLAGYLVPFEPAWDGGHLTWLWARIMEQTIFFPWHIPTAGTRMRYDMPPPDILHRTTMEFLAAGDDYRAPYAAALAGDGAERVAALSVPALISAHAMDPIGHHLDRLGPVPACVTIERPEGERETMWARFHEWLRAHPAEPPPAAPEMRSGRGYLRAPQGQLAWRGALEGDGQPLVLLHDAGGSSRLFAPCLSEIAARRPVLAIDLPGHGESGDDFAEGFDTVDAFADALAAALNAAGIAEGAAVGFHLGGQIAARLAGRGAVGRAGAIGAPIYTDAEREAHLEHYAPSIAVRWNGAHLLTAWHLMRLQALYYPWYRRDRDHIIAGEPRVAPGIVHRRAVDLLKAGERYRAACAAQFRCGAEKTFGSAPVAMLYAAAFDPLSGETRMQRLHRACTGAPEIRALDNDIGRWAETLADA